MNPPNHRGTIARAFDALELHSGGDYSWFGERFTGGVGRVLAWRLAIRLYLDFFASGGAMPAPDRRISPLAIGRTDLMARLTAANCGRGSRDPGWRVTDADGATVRVERGGITLWVSPDSFAPPREGPARLGDIGSVLLPRGLKHRSPGHYTALGDLGLSPEEPLLRLYWSLTPEGAVAATQHVTKLLNERGTAFIFKALADSSAYARCDAGVLYVARDDAPGALDLARAFAAANPAGVRERVPALTQPVARGIAMADDPDDARGFGFPRCELIAAAATDAWSGGRPSPDEAMAAVEARFAAVGLSLDHPERAPALGRPAAA